MRHVIATAWASLAALVACSDEIVYRIPDPPPGATGKTDKPVFDGDGKLLDPRGDSDGDGIPDADEVDGWTITVDTDGYAVLAATTESYKEQLELRKVTSDPRYADTDGDGLDDKAERAAACDPRRVDTDGDTLSDTDELERWATSPSSVDTDGDARGADPRNPRPPLFTLFDAAELKLVPSPTDPSLLIPGVGATTPFLNDSDADGRSDYVETLGGVMSPTVADVPKLALVPTPNATLELSFITERTDGTEDTATRSVTTELGESGYVSMGSSVRLSLEHMQYGGGYTEFTVEGGCCSDIVSGDIEAGVIVKSEDRFEQEVRFDFETGGAFTANNVQHETSEAVRRREIVVKGASIHVPLDVVNEGIVPFRLADLVIGLTRFDRFTQTFAPVVELVAEDMTLAPGERRTVSLASDDVPVEAMRALMKDARSLRFSASRFALLDASGKDFDFQMGDVLQQTAILDLDYGDRSQRFFVAAHADAVHGISVGQAMVEAGVPFSAAPVDQDGTPGAEAYAIEIGGRGTELYTGAAPALGDTRAYARSGGPGPRLIRRGWFAAVQRRDDREDTQFYPNLFDAPLFPGDRVTLIYTEDLDRDGLSAFEEAAHGSSDSQLQSDATLERPSGDGLSDFWEVREGWMVETAGRAPYRVYPSPGALDSDYDGLRDDEELRVAGTDFGTGTDPWTPDTDEDGLSDRFEAEDPLGYGFSPLDAGEARPAPSVTCEVHAELEPDAYFGDPQCFVAAVPSAEADAPPAWDLLPGQAVPCSQFTKAGSTYTATLHHPNPPDVSHPEAADFTMRVPASVFEAAPGTRIESVYYEPLGRSPVCDILVHVGASAASARWMRIPCATLVDEGGHAGPDGVCDAVDLGCQAHPERCTDAITELPIAWTGTYPESLCSGPGLTTRCDPAAPGCTGAVCDTSAQGVACAGVFASGKDPDPHFVLDITIEDAQHDLAATTVHFAEADGFMVYTNEPIDPEAAAQPGAATADYHVTRRFEACVDPTKITVEAVDAIGSGEDVDVPCAWRGDPSDAGECRDYGACGDHTVRVCRTPVAVP